jgi:hypothetical protein
VGVTALLVLAGTSACGNPALKAPATSPTANPSAGTKPTLAPRQLFAVLEARRCKAPEPAACENPINPIHDTAAIAGLDGFAVAKATFSPRAIPVQGNAATVVDLEGQVAAGGLYFIDGKGAVRRLEPGGGVKTVATFPITSPQQAASFAVSPDGTHLMAAVLTYPNHQDSSDPNQPFGTFSGPWRLELEAATAGGSTSTVKTWESGTTQYPDGPGGFANMVFAGWDGQGVIVLLHAAVGTQNAWLDHQRWFRGNLARLHADGTVGPVIGPADCLPYWRPVAGRFVCTRTPSGNQSGTPVSVVSLDGSVVWSGVVPAAGQYRLTGGFTLSPDGTRLAMDGQVVTLAGGATLQLPNNFMPEGWLSADTIIGLIPGAHTAGTLGIVHTQNPQHAEDWGFSGAFVGTLQASGQPAL